MIPKLIHYCWFGPNPLPDSTQRYIASWRQFLPDYQLKLWNEQNYPYQNNHSVSYTHLRAHET